MNYNNTQAPKVALVTGAARRIGAAIVEHFHQAGFKVIIHCHHSLAEANALCHKLNQIRPNSAYVLTCDLMEKSNCRHLIEKSLEWGGQLDVLVNNASLFMATNLYTQHDDEWLAQFKLNVQVPFWLSLSAQPYLMQQAGSIINITDIHAETPLKGYAEYCQTKAALLMQTKALAREFAPHIRVNAIAPGAIAWPEHQNALKQEDKEAIIAHTLLKRHGEPIFVAQAVLALVMNPFITGQTLCVDGGRLR